MSQVSEPFYLVHTAQGIIERDALLSALASEGINAFSPPRDMSRKVTENTVDLALEGYSSFFDGFVIYISVADAEKAKSIIRSTLQSAEETATDDIGTSHFHRFVFCSLFSVLLPLLMNIVAAYHFIAMIKKKEPVRPLLFVVGIAVWIMTSLIGYVFVPPLMRKILNWFS